MDADAFGPQDVGDGSGGILVLARDQPGGHLDDRHFAAEAAENLGELQADIAAANDDQARWREIDIQHRAVREIGNLAQSRYVGDESAAADIDENSVRTQGLVVDRHRRR